MRSIVSSLVFRCAMLTAAGLPLVLVAPAAQAVDVGVSVQISQPGVYGRVDVGRFPQPTVYVQQPVIVERVRVQPQPVYMWVPPGHRKHWSRHCAKYHACGVPVYFVRDSWYEQRVQPQRGREGRVDDRRDERGDDRRDGRRDGGDERGHGKDRGHDKGKDHGRGHRD